MPGTKTAIIVGGGIGGLTTAVALQRFGIEATVLERAKSFEEIGAGLWLWRNAMNVFDKIGLGEQVHNAGCTVGFATPLSHNRVQKYFEALGTSLGSARNHGSRLSPCPN